MYSFSFLSQCEPWISWRIRHYTKGVSSNSRQEIYLTLRFVEDFACTSNALNAVWIQYLVHSVPASEGSSIEQILASGRTAREMLSQKAWTTARLSLMQKRRRWQRSLPDGSPQKPLWDQQQPPRRKIEYFSPKVIFLRSLKTSCQTQKSI